MRKQYGVVIGVVLMLMLALLGGTTYSASGATGLKARTDLIYGSEVGAWLPDGSPALDEASGVPAKTREAGVRIVRYAVADCFVGATCGTDHHAGTLAKADFNKVVQGITTTDQAVLWLKMVPIADDTIGTVKGDVFCPPWTGSASGNLPMYKALLAQVKAAGYTGPIVLESNNEMEYACWKTWKAQGAPITGAGSVGVSKRIGQHFAQTMPALKAYARTLGFSDVVVGGYIGIGGGPGWGQTCTPSSAVFGYTCGYSTRWVDEFNNAVHTAYVNNANNPDYIPDFESIHAYPHSPDFSQTAGYAFDDNIAYAYYRNWLVKTRARVNAIWGATIGNQVLFSISEWAPGINNSGGTWSGWTTSGAPEAFIAGWFKMLRGNGVTTGAGTAFWNANLFVMASESDTGTNRYYNWIHKDGTVPSWYQTFKNYATGVL